MLALFTCGGNDCLIVRQRNKSQMPFSEATKLEAKRRSASQCCICKGLFVEVYHTVQQSSGGSDDIEDAAPLCASCHDLYGTNPDKRKQIREITDKERDLFIRYGSAASEALFDFPCHFFRTPDCIGTVAYRVEFKCAIVFGGPICPPDETSTLIEAFHKFCQESDLNVIYIIISEEIAKSIKDYDGKILIEVCEELILDLEHDLCLSSKRLRHRVEKAWKHGLTMHEYIPFDAEIEDSLKQLGIKWQQAIKGPNIYLGHLTFLKIMRVNVGFTLKTANRSQQWSC